MAKKFDVAFVLPKNIDLKYFPVSQAHATFTVTGDDDPLTLQLMRDAIRDDFIATQKKINDFIVSRNAQVMRLGFNERRQKKDAQLIDAGNQTIQKMLADFKKDADAALDDFARKEAVKAEKVANAPGTAGTALKWLISFGWTMYQGSKAVADMYGAEGPLKIYDGIKGFLDALNDLVGLLGKIQDYLADEKAANAKVRAMLKSIAGKKTFSEADAKALEEAVNLFETKVLGMEITAKSLSGKIARAVALVPDKGILPAVQSEAENKLDTLLKALVKLQTTLKPVQKKLHTYKLQLGAAKAHCKKEQPTSWASWLASKAYDFKDAAWSAWEGQFEEAAQDLEEKVIDALIKKFSVPENVIVPM